MLSKYIKDNDISVADFDSMSKEELTMLAQYCKKATSGVSADEALEYGIYWSAPVFEEINEFSGAHEIIVQSVKSLLSDTQFLQLKRRVNPLEHSSSFGIDLYKRTLNFVTLHKNNTL
eukprot:gene20902-22952_t